MVNKKENPTADKKLVNVSRKVIKYLHSFGTFV